MNTVRRLVLLTVVLCAAAGCTSPLSPADRDADVLPVLLTTAPDSSAARGGGNLMGGN